MDAAQLRVFEAVARLGGMNRAAEELHTVQSNVTARIRLLEEELGRPLFRRHSRGVALTAAGQRLLPYAVRVRQLLAEARRAVEDDGTPSGSLVIGSLETTAALRLAPLLRDYVAAHPLVDLALRTGTTAELIGEVLAQRMHGAFVCGPASHPELVQEVFFREELALLTSPRLASLDQLLGAPEVRIIVLRAGCSYRQRLEEILARRGVVGVRGLEFGTLEAILSCVAAGLGVTLLPQDLLRALGRSHEVAIHRLPAAEAQVETLFIRRRDGYVGSALAAFLQLARSGTLHADAAD
jgi:DNA-binding transcriptional LysR family regulator